MPSAWVRRLRGREAGYRAAGEGKIESAFEYAEPDLSEPPQTPEEKRAFETGRRNVRLNDRLTLDEFIDQSFFIVKEGPRVDPRPSR